MRPWESDEDLCVIVERELFTCVVGDIIDRMELVHQFLPPQIQPLQQDMVVIGRAMPVLSGDVFEKRIEGTANRLSAKPFGLMLEALDDPRRCCFCKVLDHVSEYRVPTIANMRTVPNRVTAGDYKIPSKGPQTS